MNQTLNCEYELTTEGGDKISIKSDSDMVVAMGINGTMVKLSREELQAFRTQLAVIAQAKINVPNEKA